MSNFTKEQIEKMSSEERAGLIVKLQDRIKSLEKNSSNKSLSSELNEEFGGILDTATLLTKQATAAREALMGLSADGMPFAKGGPLGTALQESTANIDAMLGSAKTGASTFASLSKSISGFSQMNKATLSGTKSLSSELSTQAAVLKKVGLGLGDFSKNVDMAVYSFGLAQEGVQSLNMEIVKLADQVNMLPGDVSRNFQLVAKNLAYDFGKIKEQFVGIQKLSQQTGVSVDSLVGTFGKGLDTISGASGFAAQINSLLGSNVFSSTELLMMDEATRMKTVRERIMADQSIMGAMGRGGVERKFALQSISSAIGMSMDDTRRFLETGEAGSVKSKVGEQVKDDYKNQTKAFKDGIDDSKLASTLEDFVRTIRRTQLTSTSRQLMSNREEQIRQMRSGTGTYANRLRGLARGQLAADMGPMDFVEGGSLDMAAAAMGKGQTESVTELLQRAQMFTGTKHAIDDDTIKSILSGLSGNPDEVAAANQQLTSVLADEGRQKAFSAIQSSPAVISMIAAAPAVGGGRRRLINQFLKSADDEGQIDPNTELGKRIAAEEERIKDRGGDTVTPATPKRLSRKRPLSERKTPQASTEPDDVGTRGASVTNIYLDQDNKLLSLIQNVVDGEIKTVVE